MFLNGKILGDDDQRQRSSQPAAEPAQPAAGPGAEHPAGERDVLARSQLSPTIFHEPWWLEIATNGHYQEASVASGGRLVGRLPYTVTKKIGGIKLVGMPVMTHVLGPALAPELAGPTSARSLKAFSIARELVAQLPKAAHTSFRLHGGISNTLAFDVAGYNNGIQFTVEIKPDTQDVLWRQLRDKTRNVIRRADEKLALRVADSPVEFMDFYEANLREKGVRNNYDRDMCLAMLNACLARRCGRILTASDPQGRLEAAIFTVWDQRREYYFMSTRLAKTMGGATSLLIWAALRHAASLGLVFDMDGVHVKDNFLPNLLLLTGFGGTMTPRYCVSKTSPIVRFGRDMQRMLKL